MVFRNGCAAAEKAWEAPGAWRLRGAGARRKAGKTASDGEILYLEVREQKIELPYKSERWPKNFDILSASAYVLRGPIEPSPGFREGEAEAPAAPPAEHVTVVGFYLKLFRKLVWELALRHGYRGPEHAVLLVDGSQSASRTVWGLFNGATRIVDFRELELQALRCASHIFDGADQLDLLERYQGEEIPKIEDRPAEWADQILLNAWDGDVDEAAGYAKAADYFDGPDETREFLGYLKKNRKLMDYPAFRRRGLYPGDGALRRVPRLDLEGWLSDYWVEDWNEDSLQAAATLLDKHRSGLWDRDVAVPARAVFG
jgi:hypothetical protein